MPNSIDSPFGQVPTSWEEDIVEQAPMPQAPPLKLQEPLTPDDPADLAKSWVGQMTRLGPETYVDDKTASLLTALKALGLPMGSPKEILFVGSLMDDESVLNDNISWFNDVEWGHLLAWLAKLPSKISYSIGMIQLAQVLDPATELLKSLKDLQFEIAPASPKTQALLKLISGSNSQSALIAQQILAMDPAAMSELIANSDPQLTNPSSLSQIKSPKAPAAPVMPQPPTESSNPEIKMTMPEVNKWGVDPIPSKIPAGGAQNISKQIADFTHNYEDRLVGLPPDVKPAPYGEKILRQQVFPAGKSSKGLANVPVTGGMFLKDNKNGRDAQAIGLAPGGMLAVRLFPGGQYDLWDTMSDVIEVSANRPPKRNY